MAKVKIKNRSHNDQAVAFQPLSQSSPFRVVQALVEVKSNCYVTVPIQVVKTSYAFNFHIKPNVFSSSRACLAKLSRN